MISLGVDGYRTEDIIKQLHFNNGARESFITADLLNKHDVKIGELPILNHEGNVKFDSEAEIQRVGSLSVKENLFNDIDWLSDRVRPIFNLRMPDGGFAKWSLGVFIIASPVRRITNSGVYRDLELYDKNIILKEDKITERLFFDANKKYTDLIKDIINSAGIPQVEIQDSPLTIPISREFDLGTSKLDIINELLAEINYNPIWVDNNGSFQINKYVEPSKREVEYTYRGDELSIITPEANENIDLFNAPNVWHVVYSNPEQLPKVATYENNSLSNITSIPNRGRRIVKIVKIDNIPDQNTLESLTRRIAYSDSQVHSKFTFNTAIMPHHSNLDMLFVDVPTMGVSTKYIESGWRIDFSGTMSHECKKIIYL